MGIAAPVADSNQFKPGEIEAQERLPNGLFRTEMTPSGPATKTDNFIVSGKQDLFRDHSPMEGRIRGLTAGVLGCVYGGLSAAANAWITVFHGTSIVADQIRGNEILKNTAYVVGAATCAYSAYSWQNNVLLWTTSGILSSSFVMSLMLTPGGGEKGDKTNSAKRAWKSLQGVGKSAVFGLGMPLVGLRALIQPRESLGNFHSLEKFLHGHEGTERLNTLTLRDIQKVVAPLVQKFLFQGAGFSPTQMLGLDRVGGLADRVGKDTRFVVLTKPKKK